VFAQTVHLVYARNGLIIIKVVLTALLNLKCIVHILISVLIPVNIFNSSAIYIFRLKVVLFNVVLLLQTKGEFKVAVTQTKFQIIRIVFSVLAARVETVFFPVQKRRQ
jgi:hypothetical protein